MIQYQKNVQISDDSQAVLQRFVKNSKNTQAWSLS